MRHSKRWLSLLLVLAMVASLLTVAAPVLAQEATEETPLTLTAATASSQATADMSPSLLIDGKVGVPDGATSFWSSVPVADRTPAAAACAWAQVELAETSTVRKVVLAPRAWNICYPTGLEFYGSTDGENWTLIQAYTGLTPLVEEGSLSATADPMLQTYTFDTPADVRYLRVVATEYQLDNSKSGFYFQLSEITVYGEAVPVEAQSLTLINPTASTEANNDMGAWRLTDGILGYPSETSFWSSIGFAQRSPAEEDRPWAQVQLESPAIVTEVSLAPRAWNLCYPTGLEFYASDDGENWTLIQKYTDGPVLAEEGKVPTANPDPIVQTYTFDNPIRAAYLRVVATDCQADTDGKTFYFQLSEITAKGYPTEIPPAEIEKLTITQAEATPADPGQWPMESVGADRLFNGNYEDYWSSHPAPSKPVSEENPFYITLTLSKHTLTVSRLVLYPRTKIPKTDVSLFFPKDFSLEYLAADGSWQPIPGQSYTGCNPNSEPQVYNFDPIDTKNIRIKVTGVTSWDADLEKEDAARANLSEIEAFGTRSSSILIPKDDTVGTAPMAITVGSERGDDNIAGKLTDGKSGTYYSSAVHTQAAVADGEEFISFLYEKKYRFTGISLTPHFSEDADPLAFPTAFHLEYRTQANGAWQPIPGQSYTDYTAGSSIQKFTFDAIDAIGIRLVVDALGTNADGEYVLELTEARLVASSIPSDARLTVPVAILSGEANNYVDPGKDGSMRPQFAVDGNTATFWSSYYERWLVENDLIPLLYTVHLRDTSEVTRIVLVQRSEGGVLVNFPKDFTLSYSMDGENWTEIASYTNYKAVGEQQVFDLPEAVTAKHIRLSVTHCETPEAYCQIAEFEVYSNFESDPEQRKDFGEKYYLTEEVDDSAYTSGVSSRSYGSRTLKTGAEGAMAVFTDVDFGTEGSSALSVHANYAGYWRDYSRLETEGVEAMYDWACWEDASLEFYLDNMESDPIAKVYIDYGEGRVDAEYQEKVSALSRTITGRHDLIVKFCDDRSTFEWIQLSLEEAGPSDIEKLVADYQQNLPDMSALKNMASDTWAGTDILGRVLPTNEGKESTVNSDKVVGMFFWNWNYGDNFLDGQDSPIYDISERQANGEGPGPFYSAQHWGESVYGYYSALDPWVIRRQGELLADAGVDVIFFDCTNGDLTWRSAYLELIKVWNQLLCEGANMPKVSFILPFGMNSNNVTNLENLYEWLYEPGLYKDCWYYLDGKPLILNGLTNSTPEYLKDFFSSKPVIATYNNAAPSTPTNAMTWLELYPQNKYVDSQGRSYMSVGVAMNWNGEKMGISAMNGENIIGRTTTRNEDGSWEYGPAIADETSLEGRNFQQQWDRAIAEDVDFVFVTGWNEWLAGRHRNWGDAGAGTVLESAIVDTYDAEYSRDIEPSTGILKDAYYTQLVTNIRNFKGQNAIPQEDTARTMTVDGEFDDWKDAMTYETYANDVEDRDFLGRGSHSYTNTSGRNDIVLAKTAVDEKYVFFYAETADDMTGMTDGSFMQLYINADRDGESGWEGYDFLLNGVEPNEYYMTLQRHAGDGYSWTKCAKVAYRIVGNRLEVAIPRSALGLTEDYVNLEFKWMDNVIDADAPDIMDVYTQGDAAPGSRFNYVFKTTETMEYPEAPVQDPITAFDVTVTVENGSWTGEATAEVLKDYTVTFRANKGYALPAEVTVQLNNEVLPADLYQYDPATGILVIPAEKIIGDLTIHAVCTALPPDSGSGSSSGSSSSSSTDNGSASDTGSSSAASQPSTPQTGDPGSVTLYTLLLVISLSGLAVLVYRRRRA